MSRRVSIQALSWVVVGEIEETILYRDVAIKGLEEDLEMEERVVEVGIGVGTVGSVR